MQGNGGSHVRREKIYHRLFEIGIWLKALDGVVELGCGFLLLIASPDALNRYVIVLTHGEMQEDSGNFFVNALRHAASHLATNSKLAGGAYLLGNGVIKIFLAAGILRGKLWCYPAAMIVISLFVLSLCGRLVFHFSFPMLIACFIDIAIVLLIWREYRYINRR